MSATHRPRGNGPVSVRADDAPTPPPLPLPHERDQALGQSGAEPRQKMEQARRDLEAGQVDTDLHATPGLDAERLKELVTPVKPAADQGLPAPAGSPARPQVQTTEKALEKAPARSPAAMPASPKR